MRARRRKVRLSPVVKPDVPVAAAAAVGGVAGALTDGSPPSGALLCESLSLIGNGRRPSSVVSGGNGGTGAMVADGRRLSTASGRVGRDALSLFTSCAHSRLYIMCHL